MVEGHSANLLGQIFLPQATTKLDPKSFVLGQQLCGLVDMQDMCFNDMFKFTFVKRQHIPMDKA
jgi:hypothetical protein